MGVTGARVVHSHRNNVRNCALARTKLHNTPHLRAELFVQGEPIPHTWSGHRYRIDSVHAAPHRRRTTGPTTCHQDRCHLFGDSAGSSCDVDPAVAQGGVTGQDCKVVPLHIAKYPLSCLVVQPTVEFDHESPLVGTPRSRTYHPLVLRLAD